MSTEKAIRPFGLRDKLGYMFGDFGNDFTFILSTMLLTKFYTDVMGISAAIIGTIMMFSRFVDAVTDVTMGRICDKSRLTRVGKFKPWILRMCIPVSIASFFMYQSGLRGLSYSFKVVYLASTYILWGSIFYTSINIPYGSMASAISADPNDRQSLSTFRTIGGVLAGMIIGIGLPLIAYSKNSSGNTILVGNRVTIAAGIFSILAIGCYLLCYKLVTERVQVGNEQKQKSASVGKMLKNAFTNRALLSIIVASILMLLAQLTMQNMSAYIFPDYYNNAGAQSVSTAFMLVGMIVAAIIAKPLSNKFGKAEISIVSNIFAAGICILTFLIRPQNVWVFCGLQLLNWLGLGVFSMVSWALITDVIDYSEIKNGIREDGSVYSMYSFARKLGQAFAAGVSGWLLAFIGYSSSAAQNGLPQTQKVLDGIFNISTLVPAIGFLLLGLVLWFWYPLNKTQVDKNVQILKEKHANEQADYELNEKTKEMVGQNASVDNQAFVKEQVIDDSKDNKEE